MSKEEAIKLWKERVLDRSNEIDAGDECCWDSMAIGFFLALDFSLDEAEELLNEVTNKGLI